MFQIQKFETFADAAANCVLDRAALESAQSACLTKYLSELKVQSYVVEPDYTDGGYLLDYAYYYSRCHTTYEKTTHRIHFFSISKTELAQEIEQSLSNGIAPERVQHHYQGFVVVKPLPKTIIGRTCLRTYDPVDSKSKRRRVFPITRHYSASLFGIDLTVESIAFQEQDKETAACATAAIWYALHGMPKKLTTHEIASPYEITNTSSTTYIKRTIGDVSRRFPTGGLGLEQIESYLRSYGLECIVCGIASDELNEKLKDYLASYVLAGYPMIVVGHMYASRHPDRDFRHLGLHAVTALGFAKHERFDAGCTSDRIERLFAHDDNIGPFTSFHFNKCKKGEFANQLYQPLRDASPTETSVAPPSDISSLPTGTGQEAEITGYLSNQSGLAKERITYRNLVPGYLIIPINSKIRVPYEIVRTFARQVSEAYERKKGVWFEVGKASRLAWNVQLTEVSALKSMLWNLKSVTRDSDLFALLSMPMPKYIWQLTFTSLSTEHSVEVPWVDFLLDATDLLQGGGVIGILKHDLNPDSEAFLSLIIAAVREWINKYPEQAHPDVLPLLHTIYREFETAK